jgi:hypothetical protein
LISFVSHSSRKWIITGKIQIATVHQEKGIAINLLMFLVHSFDKIENSWQEEHGVPSPTLLVISPLLLASVERILID